MRRVLSRYAQWLEHVLLSRRAPHVILLCALCIRLAWIFWTDARPISDFSWYYGRGLTIAEGQGYSVNNDGLPLWKPGTPFAQPAPTAFWPVGYPAFLGGLLWITRALGEPLLISKLANVALYLAAMLIVAYAARVIFDSPLT